MIRMISQYNHFPTQTADPNDMTAPRMYVDGKIWQAMEESKEDTDLLMFIEPRSLQKDNYEWAMLNYNRFRYIFTHDSQLQSFAPNAMPIYYWRDYEVSRIHWSRKQWGISMICGTKEMCPLHIERMKIADAIKDRVDVLGDYTGPHCSIDEAYTYYKFAVVIENYRDDWWFTEKLLNAFSHETVPIYYGARKIDQIFNPKGIIQVNSLWDIPDIVDILLEDGLDNTYQKMLPAIQDNKYNVLRYADFEDYFFSEYEELINRLGEELKCTS